MTQKKNELATSQPNEPLELLYSKEVKIKNLTDSNEIIQLLNYLYVLLNVKKENQLNEIEESVLNGVILDNFKNYTVNEIKHAFRLAVSGNIKIELFNKLDAIVLGKVLKVYKEHKNEQIKFHNNKPRRMELEKPTEEQIKGIEAHFIQNCIIPYFEESKALETANISQTNNSIFKFLYKRKIIKLTKTEITKYKKQALTRWIEDLKQRRFKGERISIDEAMSQKTAKMYAHCIALFDKLEKTEKAFNEYQLNEL